MTELGASGKLRVGIAVSTAPSASFATIDQASGKPRGVAVDLGAALARKLEVQIELVQFPNSGELTEAVAGKAVDVAFMPMDAERAKKVNFSTPYVLFESTFLVPAGSAISSLADVDRADVRPGGIANTTTARSAMRFLKKATLIEARSVDELAGMMVAGKLDAIALSRESLSSLAATMPGARILDGKFHASGVGAAIAKNQPEALKFISGFIEEAKASGLVRRALDDMGLKNTTVAPPGSLR
ncbi:MAG: transporter substrate-binding domain-containing protein [Rhizobiales bacterium]|nr:transporter substrate-binding domain-containing protein [Hyphomicrobiales bacterium]